MTSVPKFAIAVACLLVSGCGGELSSPFTNAAYIQIKPGGALQPAGISIRNGTRLVFLNDDSVSHAITWESPLTLSATASAGGRAWFELPPLLVGTVVHYHLDAGGAAGSVTILGPQ